MGRRIGEWRNVVGSVGDAGGCCFFFFQAEDGIRGVAVTGVQTCALPISAPRPHLAPSAPKRAVPARASAALPSVTGAAGATPAPAGAARPAQPAQPARPDRKSVG